jgi:hypothetical protein
MTTRQGVAYGYNVYLTGDSANPSRARDAASDLTGLNKPLGVGTQCVQIGTPRAEKGTTRWVVPLEVRGGNVERGQVESAVLKLMRQKGYTATTTRLGA